MHSIGQSIKSPLCPLGGFAQNHVRASVRPTFIKLFSFHLSFPFPFPILTTVLRSTHYRATLWYSVNTIGILQESTPAGLGDYHLVGDAVKLSPKLAVLKGDRQSSLSGVRLESAGSQLDVHGWQQLWTLCRCERQRTSWYWLYVITHRRSTHSA